jgi:5-methylcytosine-specific restriction endonuclease McrA
VTWVKTSDDKFEEYELRMAGPLAAFLFALALGKCAAVDGDGLLPEMMVKDAAHLYDLKWRQLAPKLVAAGEWHDSETVKVCLDCMDDGGKRCTPGSFFIHAWRSYLLDAKGKSDRVHRWRQARKTNLNQRPALKAQVRKRDRDLCRYCGVLTRWDGDRRSKVAGTYDHVDPFCEDGEGGFGNTMKNLAVACRTCNGRKKDRTPEQAGMVLRAEPGPYLPSINDDQVQNPDRELIEPSGDQAEINASHGRARETGPNRIGPGSVPGPGPSQELIERGPDLAVVS